MFVAENRTSVNKQANGSGNQRVLHHNCLICESSRMHYAFISNGFPICRCEDCGFLFMNPQPSEEELADIYNSQYFLGGEDDITSRTAMKCSTAELYIDEIVKRIGQPCGKLLEIGCGGGELLLLAKKAGFEIYGIEISEHATKSANELLGDECVKCGTVETINLPYNFYDVCVLSDVVEHVRDPFRMLQEIHRLLKPGGLIFLVTPSLDSWYARVLKQNWMEFKVEHLYYFDENTIRNILTKAAFHEIEIKTNNKALTYRYITQHFIKFRVPFLSTFIKFVGWLLPKFIQEYRVNIVSSGINVSARKTDIQEHPVVSVIVPLYNEINTVRQLLSQVKEKKLENVDKEIIVIESNSTDGTREELKEFVKGTNIKLILEDKPRGKGHAVRQGLREATGDIILIQDGDLEYDINDYDQLLEPILNYQNAFILGSRHSGSWKMRHFEKAPMISIMMNIGQVFFRWLLNAFCGSSLKDPFTMYKVFRRDCLHNLYLTANYFDFDWEIVIKLIRKGYYPYEIPVNYSSRSFSAGKKIRIFRDISSWLVGVVKFRFGRLNIQR